MERNVWPSEEVFPYRDRLESLHRSLQRLSEQLLFVLAAGPDKPLPDALGTLTLLHFPKLPDKGSVSDTRRVSRTEVNSRTRVDSVTKDDSLDQNDRAPKEPSATIAQPTALDDFAAREARRIERLKHMWSFIGDSTTTLTDAYLAWEEEKKTYDKPILRPNPELTVEVLIKDLDKTEITGRAEKDCARLELESPIDEKPATLHTKLRSGNQPMRLIQEPRVHEGILQLLFPMYSGWFETLSLLGEWIEIPFITDAIIVVVGDSMEKLSGGRFRSPSLRRRGPLVPRRRRGTGFRAKRSRADETNPHDRVDETDHKDIELRFSLEPGE